MREKQTENFYDMYRNENSSFVREYDERMKKIRDTRQSSTQRFTIRLFIILFIFALGSALFSTIYFAQFGAKKDPLTFELSGPSSVKSGEMASYDMQIKNTGSFPLEDISLNVEYPQGFHFDTANKESANTDHTYWKLDPIKTSGITILTIKGTMTGANSEEKKIHATLQYRLGENRTEFVSKKEHTTLISDQLIPMELKGPHIVEPGQDIIYIIRYGNIQALGGDGHAFIRLQSPKQFTYDVTPAQDADHAWSDAVLSKHYDQVKGFGEIRINGSFEKDLLGAFDLIAQIGSLKNGTYIVTQEQTIHITTVHDPLSLAVSMNGSNDAHAISFDSELPMLIHYENKGTDELTDVSITLSSDSPYLDWSALKNESLGRINDNTVEWTSKEIPELALIKPGQKGELKITYATKDALVASRIIEKNGEKGKQLTLSFSLQASMNHVSTEEAYSIRNQPMSIVIPLNSDTKLISSIRNGESKTNVLLNYDVENSLHEIKDIAISIPFGNLIVWGGAATRSAGDISYDQEHAAARWTLNRLPLSIASIHAAFKAVLPMPADQMDPHAIIINSAILTATDTVTQGIVHFELPPVTAGDIAALQEMH